MESGIKQDLNLDINTPAATNEAVTCIFFSLKISLQVSVNKKKPPKIEERQLTGEWVRAFGEVLEEQRAVLAQHVGFQRQQTVLTHQSRAQVGDSGGLERVLLVRSQGLMDVAGFPAQQRFLHVGVGVRPLHPAVRAAGLRPGHISTCRREDAVRDTGKLPAQGPGPCTCPTVRLGNRTRNAATIILALLFTWECCFSSPFSCLTAGGSVFPARSLLPHQLGFSSVPHAMKAGPREGMCILSTTWIKVFIYLKLRIQDGLLVLKLQSKV